MTRRLSMDEAVGLLEGELGSGQRALDDLVTEDLWLGFLRFGRRLFDVPDTPDADGLLFQYGTHAFDGPPAFTLDLTRQFEISDSDGDHDLTCRSTASSDTDSHPLWRPSEASTRGSSTMPEMISKSGLKD
ncbi:hypothetical protein [Streptomyces sp. NPDC002788]